MHHAHGSLLGVFKCPSSHRWLFACVCLLFCLSFFGLDKDMQEGKRKSISTLLNYFIGQYFGLFNLNLFFKRVMMAERRIIKMSSRKRVECGINDFRYPGVSSASR